MISQNSTRTSTLVRLWTDGIDHHVMLSITTTLARRQPKYWGRRNVRNLALSPQIRCHTSDIRPAPGQRRSDGHNDVGLHASELISDQSYSPTLKHRISVWKSALRDSEKGLNYSLSWVIGAMKNRCKWSMWYNLNTSVSTILYSVLLCYFALCVIYICFNVFL